MIEQAIHKIDPTYEITVRQQRDIDIARDPEDVAAILPEQVESNRLRIASGLGVSPEHVTLGDGLSVAFLTRPVKGRSVGSDGLAVAEMVPPLRLVEIGRREARAQAAGTHWIVALYLEHDGRFPDPEGFAFWLGLLADGHSPEAVRGWIADGFEK